MLNSDLEALAAELADFAPPEKKSGRPASEERVIAGFEEIQRFTEQYGRAPQCGSTACARSRIAAPCLSRWTIRACLLERQPLPLRRSKTSISTSWRASPTRTTSRSCAMFEPVPKSAPPRRSRIASPARISRPSLCRKASEGIGQPKC